MANNMAVKSDEEVRTFVGNTVDLPTDGIQETDIFVSLFALNSNLIWSDKGEGEGEPNTPPRSISPGIAMPEETQNQNSLDVKGQLVKKNRKCWLLNSLAKGIAKSIDRSSNMYSN